MHILRIRQSDLIVSPMGDDVVGDQFRLQFTAVQGADAFDNSTI